MTIVLFPNKDLISDTGSHVLPTGDTNQLKATMLLEFHKAGALLALTGDLQALSGKTPGLMPVDYANCVFSGKLTLDLKCKYPKLDLETCV